MVTKSDVYQQLERTPGFSQRYKDLVILGEGAAGVVFKARDLDRGGEEIALKVLLDDSAFDEHTRERFESEIEILKSISHPNIVRAYEAITTGDLIGYSMEYVSGADLSELLTRRPLEDQEASWVVSEVLLGLAELHAHGIVHRDIKLENVLLDDAGIVKISDLGLVKRLDSEKLTKTGIILGTAQYLPPEYITHGTLDERGDIYACGILLLELLNGRRYLSDLAGGKAVEYLLRQHFTLPREMTDPLTPRMRAILTCATDPDPGRRFHTANAFRESLLSPEMPAERENRADLEESKHPKGLRQTQKIALFLVMAIGVAVLVTLLAVLMKRQAVAKELSIFSPGFYQGTIDLPRDGPIETIEIFSDGRQLRVRISSLANESVVSPWNASIRFQGATFLFLTGRVHGDVYFGRLVAKGTGNEYPYEVTKVDS